ncbi:MAG: hypothetical protein KDA83_07670 [Planctomycetales bacterium]|nr:hypothetical protein [Planctomycetales bacterium]
MDPLHFFIAMGPLAAYSALMGRTNTLGRPFVTSGARDAAALGVALTGVAAAGPLELFLPESANRWFPGGIWILLLLLYSLSLSLVVLLLRPRVVVYNVGLEDFRPRLASVVKQLDNDSRWAGDCVTLPSLHVQLTIEYQPWTRTVQLVSAGGRQDPLGWKQVERSLAKELREVKSPSLPIGYGLLAFGLLLACGSAIWVTLARQSVADSLAEMLRL